MTKGNDIFLYIFLIASVHVQHEMHILGKKKRKSKREKEGQKSGMGGNEHTF